MFNSYLQAIKDAFGKLPPPEQEKFLRKAAVIVTVGVTVLILGLFYGLVPREGRMVLVPLMCFIGWFVADLFIDAAGHFNHLSAVVRSNMLQNAIRLVSILVAALAVLMFYAH